MHTRCYPGAGLVLLLMVASSFAAPIPDADREAREKLEALRKKLPDIVAKWSKESGRAITQPYNWRCETELRVLRRIGPNRAKATILFAAYDENGVRRSNGDSLMTVFFAYQDGCWTSKRFEVEGTSSTNTWRTPYALLVLAIDESFEK